MLKSPLCVLLVLRVCYEGRAGKCVYDFATFMSYNIPAGWSPEPLF